MNLLVCKVGTEEITGDVDLILVPFS